MLCPEVWNFPPPKVMELKRQNQDLESVKNIINRNFFYKSIIVTCPDEVQPPTCVQETLTEDSEYYKLSDCSLTELVEPTFIESFVKKGHIFCLSANRNCVTQNCVAVIPDGILTLHILEHIFQTLGFEGTKRPYNYYEVRIDLKNIRNHEKVKLSLSKLELFDLNLIWEPYDENICPSSIAKYFDYRNINVSVHSLNVVSLSPDISQVPSTKDVEVEEITEWIGMLSHKADMNPSEAYISSYSQPESENPLKTSRISLYIVKGFIPSSLICHLCEKMNEYVTSREAENYWASISLQSDENSLWQWSASSPKMFQCHDSSCNVIFEHESHKIYSIGQIKYS